MAKNVLRNRDNFFPPQRSGLGRLPGWHNGNVSFGYHADDGHFYGRTMRLGREPRPGASSFMARDPDGQRFKWPKYGQNGDVIGCGVDMQRQWLFYSRNGKYLGVASNVIPDDPFPVVGLISEGVAIEVNFGQKPFKFDPSKYAAEIAVRGGAPANKPLR